MQKCTAKALAWNSDKQRRARIRASHCITTAHFPILKSHLPAAPRDRNQSDFN